MQIIKCYNCENEISDTEIVCPYCDYPVSTSKKKIEEEKAALSGETVKIATGKDFEKEKAAILNSIKIAEEAATDDSAYADDVAQVDTPANEEADEEAAKRAEKEAVFEMQSETLRRSLEERRAEREAARRKKKSKKSMMILVIALIVAGAFIIINLTTQLVYNLAGTTKESQNRKPRKEKVSTSDAVVYEGFKFHSRTLTIEDRSLIEEGFNGNSNDKPWSEISNEVVFLTLTKNIDVIGPYSFDDLLNLEHVTLSDTVTIIGESAFYGCTNLEEVTINTESSNLKSISNNAFTNCESLEKIKIGNKTVRIGDAAFSGCSKLEEITIPDSVTEIGKDAFLGCHDLIMVCNKDSYAYKYAVENNIEVEIMDETEEQEEDDSSDETQSSNASDNNSNDQGESSSEKSETVQKETTPKQEDSSSSNGAEQSQPSQEEIDKAAKDAKLAELRTQLANAQNDEEINRILTEIEKVATAQ